MPDYSRSRIPRMKYLSIAEQDAYMSRWQVRHQLRTLYKEIITALLQWVIDVDQVSIKNFVAVGHEGLFAAIPDNDLAVRLTTIGYTAHEIRDAIDHDEPPLNWMTKEEMVAVIERIELMKEFFTTEQPGAYLEAYQMYFIIGQIVRQNFMRQYTYLPEQSLVPRVRITGDEGERKKLKPSDHQPQLM